MNFRISFAFLFFIIPSFSLLAQNNTSSPYSGFGIGELEMASGGRNTAMGQTGIGLRSDLFLNTENPASLTAIEPQNFLYDLGFNFMYSNLANSDKSVNVTNGNIAWLQMGFPISKKLFGGLALNPKSSVGYNIYSLRTIQGTASAYPAIYEGSGGLSEAAGLLAWKLSENISFGAKAGYIWGNITQTLQQGIYISETTYTITQNDNIHYSGAYLNMGAQFSVPISPRYALVLGSTVGLSSQLNSKTSTDITKAYGSTSEIISSDVKSNGSMKLPLELGFGASLTYNSKLVTTFDFKQSHWEDATLYMKSYELTTNNSFRGGLEYAPKNDPTIRRQVKRYRIGYRYETGYLVMFNTQIHEQAMTLGIGLPIKKDRSYANFSLELGMRGTKMSHLVEEKYIKLNCSFNLWDRWFVKRQYE